MKKEKKNGLQIAAIIVLVIGLVLGIGLMLIGRNNNSMSAKEKEEQIEIQKQEIQEEIDEINTELATLKAEKNKEFRENGFSEEYYLKENEITKKEQQVIDLETKLWKLEVDFEGTFNNVGNKIFSSAKFIFAIVIIIMSVIISTILTVFSKSLGMTSSINRLFNGDSLSYEEYEELDDAALSAVNIKNKNLIKKELYERTTEVLTSWTKSDYKNIKKLCTPEVSKSYIDELELLKKHGQQTTIKDFENVGSKLVEARKNGDSLVIKLIQKIKLYDYTTDKNGEVVFGDKEEKQTITYKLIFIKENSVQNNTNKKCPNCGATISSSTSNCEYCNTSLSLKSKDWLLAAKTIIDKE